MFACLLAAEKETTARAGDPCNAAQHCRCHPVGLQQKVAATHAVNHIGPLRWLCPSGRCAGSAGVSRPAPDIYTSRPTYIKDTTRRNTTPSAVAAAAATAAREWRFLSVRISLATIRRRRRSLKCRYASEKKCSGIKVRYVSSAVAE